MKRFIFFGCLIIWISAIAVAQENEAVPRFSLGDGSFVKSDDVWNNGAVFQIGWKVWF